MLHICENGTDVLVMEMFEGHLQVVAGLLEKLIERLADENAQGKESEYYFISTNAAASIKNDSNSFQFPSF